MGNSPQIEGSRPTFPTLSISIGTKIAAVAVVAIAGMAVTGLFLGAELEAARYEARELSTRTVVETVNSVFVHHHALEQEGVLTTEEAQARSLAIVESMRYDEVEYFWVHDRDSIMQMHPIKPELNGQNLSTLEDPDGVFLFVEMEKVVAADGAGYVAYQWPKPGEEEPQPKLSYVAEFEPWSWVTGSGVYVDDVEAAVAADRRNLGITLSAIAAVTLAVILLVRRSVTRPLNKMMAVLQEGDLRTQLPERDRRSDLDRLAGAINDNLARVRTVVDGVAQASRQVQDQVEGLTRSTAAIERQASQTEEQASAASELTGQAVGGFSGVAEAVSEIDVSIRTISENAQNVASVADDAVELAAKSNELVSRLGASSGEIGEVVGTINSIAEKTNLLALNATIESSRAGEAGRGFAVVANEVKELANATAVATENIGRQIQALQLDANESVVAIERITEVVSELNNYQNGIAAAVEEQAVTMSEVTQGVQDSSRAGAESGQVIQTVADAAAQTRTQLDHVTSSVRVLQDISAGLETSIAAYER